jgi:metallo-beta-lactamase family protein
MRITFLGASGSEVTGSSYLVQTATSSVMVDFGLFQGGSGADKLNVLPKGVDFKNLKAVLLTHAHLDHCGRLPLLVQTGFRGRVYATPGTRDIAALILRDSAKIQASDLERINRKRQRAGQQPKPVLYTIEDVEKVLNQFEPLPYHQEVKVAEGLFLTVAEAGHMLGSASFSLQQRGAGRNTTVVFSGDLGPRGAPILRDAEPFTKADLVLMESTYGDRDHRSLDDTVREFTDIIAKVVARRGKLLVPAFAVGRVQQLLYHLALMFRSGRVPKFPVYIDSPMAIEATAIYRRHPELFDDELQALNPRRMTEEDLTSVKTSVTADQSKALNQLTGPCLIMAGAGMCNAGRILHHLKQNLWKPETAVLIVGYQAPGSLGRMLVDGAKQVKIFGEPISVKASVHTLGGFSAHAGQTDLLHWLGQVAPSRPQVALIHGEDRAHKPLAAKIQQQFGITCILPNLNQTIVVGEG